MNPIEETTIAALQQATAPEVTKVKKLKLKPFDMVMNDNVAVILQEYHIQDGETGEIETGYGAMLVIWVSTKKEEDFPIVMHLPIAGECYTKVAYDALVLASGMCESVESNITVLDEEGIETFSLDADDVVSDYLDCAECSGS